MLASILLQRVSGMMLIPGSQGALHAVSSRKKCLGPVLTPCLRPNCYVSIYLDGARITSPGAPPVDLNEISVSDIGGVEFYAGGGVGPAQYNATDNGCGTLILWSREQ